MRRTAICRARSAGEGEHREGDLAGVKIDVVRTNGEESWVASWEFDPEEVGTIDIEEVIRIMRRALLPEGDGGDALGEIITKYLK